MIPVSVATHCVSSVTYVAALSMGLGVRTLVGLASSPGGGESSSEKADEPVRNGMRSAHVVGSAGFQTRKSRLVPQSSPLVWFALRSSGVELGIPRPKEERLMCLSCGCGEPNESHGNEDHITQDKLQRAAEAANVSAKEAAENISKALQG